MARGDTQMAKKGKTKRSTVRSKRKPDNPREALASRNIWRTSRRAGGASSGLPIRGAFGGLPMR
jgi:hypothetical protein